MAETAAVAVEVAAAVTVVKAQVEAQVIAAEIAVAVRVAVPEMIMSVTVSVAVTSVSTSVPATMVASAITMVTATFQLAAVAELARPTTAPDSHNLGLGPTARRCAGTSRYASVTQLQTTRSSVAGRGPSGAGTVVILTGGFPTIANDITRALRATGRSLRATT